MDKLNIFFFCLILAFLAYNIHLSAQSNLAHIENAETYYEKYAQMDSFNITNKTLNEVYNLYMEKKPESQILANIALLAICK